MKNAFKKKGLLATMFALLSLAVVGCNSYDVRPMKYDPMLKTVTVVQNPRVRVTDFLNVMEDEFCARGIGVKVENEGYVAKNGEYVVTYDAHRSWDISPYLSEASVRVKKDNHVVGSGHYRHTGGGMSLSLWKWEGTRKKMAPLYEKLLREWDR